MVRGPLPGFLGSRVAASVRMRPSSFSTSSSLPMRTSGWSSVRISATALATGVAMP